MDPLNRREFIAQTLVAGVSVVVALPGSPALAALFEGERLRPAPFDAASARMRYRTDATAKLTGEKIFSSTCAHATCRAGPRPSRTRCCCA